MLDNKDVVALIESLPAIVWAKEPDGRMVFFNKRLRDYSGKFLNTDYFDWTDILHPEEYEITINKWNISLETGLDFEIESRLKRFDGEYRWHICRATPILNEQAEIGIWIGMCSDSHENKLREYELQKKNKELTIKNSELDSFIYTASHDLKAPIINMESLTSALKDESCDESEEFLPLMEKSIDKLKDTIKDLTEVANSQKEDDSRNSFREISLRKLIDEMKANFSNLIIQSGAEINTEIYPDIIIFSYKDLKTILYNLFSNAIKFRSPDRPLKINISLSIEDNRIVISMKDNGSGFHMDRKEKIFQMFKRDNSISEGSGVGLYIVKRIVDIRGGQIKVESEFGKGSEFKICLPF